MIFECRPSPNDISDIRDPCLQIFQSHSSKVWVDAFLWQCLFGASNYAPDASLFPPTATISIKLWQGPSEKDRKGAHRGQGRLRDKCVSQPVLPPDSQRSHQYCNHDARHGHCKHPKDKASNPTFPRRVLKEGSPGSGSKWILVLGRRANGPPVCENIQAINNKLTLKQRYIRKTAKETMAGMVQKRREGAFSGRSKQNKPKIRIQKPNPNYTQHSTTYQG